MATNIEMDKGRVSLSGGWRQMLRKGWRDQALREGRDEGEAGIESVSTL